MESNKIMQRDNVKADIYDRTNYLCDHSKLINKRCYYCETLIAPKNDSNKINIGINLEMLFAQFKN